MEKEKDMLWKIMQVEKWAKEANELVERAYKSEYCNAVDDWNFAVLRLNEMEEKYGEGSKECNEAWEDCEKAYEVYKEAKKRWGQMEALLGEIMGEIMLIVKRIRGKTEEEVICKKVEKRYKEVEKICGKIIMEYFDWMDWLKKKAKLPEFKGVKEKERPISTM